MRTQYPGDSLSLVLFHDSAEEIPLSKLARVQVGPFYTNTRQGLILAQRILSRQRKDMRQIIRITDGNPPRSPSTMDASTRIPSAWTRSSSAAHSKKSINAKAGRPDQYFHVGARLCSGAVRQEITEICRGKAYFTTPYNLGEYLLMDYMNRKTRVVH